MEDTQYPTMTEGEIVRFYRKKQGYTASYVAEKLGGVSERWVYLMEQKNRVPDSMKRRQVLCTLLSIPPAMLGLAEIKSSTTSVNTDLYKSYLTLMWERYHSSGGDGLKPQVQTTIHTLEQTPDGYDRSLLLAGWYRFLSRLERDSCLYERSLISIKQAEIHAQKINNAYSYASGLLTHGRILVELQRYEDGNAFFRRVLALVQEEDTGGLRGTASIELAMSLARLKQTNQVSREIEQNIEEAYRASEAVKNDGSYTALNAGILALYRADVAFIVGSDELEDAMQEANELLPLSHSWRLGLLEVYQTKLALKENNLYAVIEAAKRAHTISNEVGSIWQQMLLKDTIEPLRQRYYTHEKEVQSLLKLLS